MRLAVTYPDPAALVVDYLRDAFDEFDIDAAVGQNVPPNWGPGDKPHLQVLVDGVPLNAHPVLIHATVRLVARSATPADSTVLASTAQGLLLGQIGFPTILLTGTLTAHDPETRLDIAANTTRVTVRSQPIEPVGS